MAYRWMEPVCEPSLELKQTYHPVIAWILAQRGVQALDDAERFLKPDYSRDSHDPFLFGDMEQAVQRIKQALIEHEKITVYCDYDVDGLASGSIIYLTIKQLGGIIDAVMNHREQDGYGLREHTIRQCISNGTKLFITTDCGISNAAEVAVAQANGADVIITDHHTVPESKEALPQAVAIIHPLVRADAYPCKLLAGGGTAFKLAQALIHSLDSELDRLRSSARNANGNQVDWHAFEKWLLDLVCLSTIGDCVPLKNENRMLVRYGLFVLGKTQRPGLKALLMKMRERKMKLTSKAVSFFLAPRINAASRMEHARLAFDLLTTESEEQAAALADILEEKNFQRQKKTEKLVSDAKEQLDIYHAERKKILVGNGAEWPLGLLGLVAGRLCDYYQKPVVLMTSGNGIISGAARSIEHVHITNVFSEMSHYFERYGGHQAAGGFALKKESSIDDVRRSLETIVDRSPYKHYGDAKILRIDAEAKLSDITWELLGLLKDFEPYGQDNLKPTIALRSVAIVKKNHVGKTGKHVRFQIEQQGVQKQCIGFSLSDTVADVQEGDYADLVCELDENEWNGMKNIQISIIDMKKCS